MLHHEIINKMKSAYKAKSNQTGMNLPDNSYYDQVLNYVSNDVALYALSKFTEKWWKLDHPGISYYFGIAQEYKQMQLKKCIL